MIIGLNISHDTSVALVAEDGVRCAIELERLTRQKHNYPPGMANKEDYLEHSLRTLHLGIDYVLQAEGIEAGDVERWAVVGTHMTGADGPERLDLRSIHSRLPSEVPLDRTRLVNHHESHAALAFFLSPFERAIVIVADGAGSVVESGVRWPGSSQSCFLSERTTIYLGEEQSLHRLRTTYNHYGHCGGRYLLYENSLGKFYNSFSRYLLAAPAGGPGKVMALAAFGSEQIPPNNVIGESVSLYGDGGYSIARISPDTMRTLLADGEDDFQRKADIARIVQHTFEQVIQHLVVGAQQLTDGERRLCLGGGAALNCVSNGKLRSQGLVDELFVPSACHDGGTSVGAAIAVGLRELGWSRPLGMSHCFWGREHSPGEYALAVRQDSGTWETPSDMAGCIVDAVGRGELVAVCTGPCEFGPRALGHRSILADPRFPGIKSRLNEVKGREHFRPFAASVLEEDTSRIFDLEPPSQFMLEVAETRRATRHLLLPGLAHADHTCRIQTVPSTVEPGRQGGLLREVLQRQKARSGVGLLMNTSFNVAGEPIVESPEDAIRCFRRSSLDCLALDRYWSSEK